MKKNKIKINFKSSLIFIFISIIWEIITRLGIFSSLLLPSPSKVFRSFLNMLFDGSLFVNIYMSLFRVFVGFFFAFILSFLLALLFYKRQSLNDYFDPLLNFLKNIPPLGLVPLLILWLGIGEVTKISMVFMASFFPLFLNIQKGFMVADNDLIEMGKSFGYKDMEIFKKIILPLSLKDIFVGARISLSYAYRSIIAAEMIAASSGLGYLINFSRLMSRTDRVIVALIVIGIIGMISDILFVKFASLFLKGDLKNDWYKS